MEVGLLTKQIENAQKRIESRNFEIRRRVLEYDDVMNQQRSIIYSQRKSVLMGEDVRGSVMEMMQTLVEYAVDTYCPAGTQAQEWDIASLSAYIARVLAPMAVPETGSRETLKSSILEGCRQAYRAREAQVDNHWMEHIDAMDQLRQGVSLRALGQRDPVTEYKFEGYDMFEQMVHSIQEDTLLMLFHFNLQSAPQRRTIAREAQRPVEQADASQRRKGAPTRAGERVGRNAPCPCGSGKKYKNCCGKNA